MSTKKTSPYTSIKKLGEGGQGSVVLVKPTDPSISQEGKLFALKRLKCEDLEELNQSLKEAQAVLRLRHPFIVKCHEFFIERKEEFSNSSTSIHEERVCIIYEYCERGSLQNIISRARTKNVTIPAKLVLKWIKQISIGMQYIHDMEIIHRDLKPGNIFLTNSTYDVKIGDFGFAKSLSAEQFANTMLGSRFYIAPEIKQQTKYTNKLDIWGIACLLLDLLLPQTVDFAYEMLAAPEKVYQTIKQRYSEAMVDFVKKVVVIDMNKRLKASEIVTLIQEMHEQLVASDQLKPFDLGVLDDESSEGNNASAISAMSSKPFLSEEDVMDQLSNEEIITMKSEIKKLAFKISELEATIEQRNEEVYFLKLQLQSKRDESGMHLLTPSRSFAITSSPTTSSSSNSSRFSHFAKKGSSSSLEDETIIQYFQGDVLIPNKEIKIDTTKEKISRWFLEAMYGTWKPKSLPTKNGEPIKVTLKSRGLSLDNNTTTTTTSAANPSATGTTTQSAASTTTTSSSSSSPQTPLDHFKKMVEYDYISKNNMHPNVEHIYGITEIQKRYYVVCESCPAQTLHSTMLNHNRTISFRMKLKIVHDIASALHHIHSNGTVFANLKASTISMSENLIPKLYFITQEVWKPTGDNLTFEYKSPQVITSTGPNGTVSGYQFTQADDVYSFGIIMWEVLFRARPYTGQQTVRLASIVAGELRPAINLETSLYAQTERISVNTKLEREYLDLMQQCWSSRAESRPTTRHIVYKLAMMLDAS